MTQFYVTTVKNAYRWNNQRKIDPILPKKQDLEDDPEVFLVTQKITDDDLEGKDIAEKKEAIKQMLRHRMISNYRISYCRDSVKSLPKNSEAVHVTTLEDQLIESCKKLFDKRELKLLPPLPTSRRLFGYLRHADLYTCLTRYEQDHGRVAYAIMQEAHNSHQ